MEGHLSQFKYKALLVDEGMESMLFMISIHRKEQKKVTGKEPIYLA